MSYILDALRKAEAQRERQRLPGLHAHPLAPAAAAPGPRTGAPAAAMGAAAAAGLVTIGVIAWWLWSEPPRAVPAAGVPERAEAPPAAVPERSAVLVAPAATEPAPAPAAPAATIVPAAPPPLQSPPARRAEESRPPAPAAQQAPAATAAPAVAAAAAPAQPQATAPSAAGAIANSPPAGAPPVTAVGGVYSADPAQRMLVVNGQVFNEGSEVAAGVKLEQVRADRRAVLRWRDQRYTVPY